MTITDYSQDPTDQDVVEHFWDYFNSVLQAHPKNIWARSIIKISCIDGKVTVLLDPASVVKDVQAFYSLMPKSFESWAGTAIAFWDEKDVWIRKRAHSLQVVDTGGNNLGSASTEAIAAVNHIDNIRG